MAFELKNPPPQSALRFLSQELMYRYSAMPVKFDEESRRLTVAMADTGDYDLINDLQVAAGVYVEPVQADEDKIMQWIGTFAERAAPAFGTSATGSMATSPTIRLVNEIISEAMHTGVSDIQFVLMMVRSPSVRRVLISV